MSDSASSALARKLVDNLQGDLRALCSEARKKYPHIKDSAESSMTMLRNLTSGSQQLRGSLLECVAAGSKDIILPFLLGCESKQPRIVQICLSGLHRLVSLHALNEMSSVLLVDQLWSLMESEIEELRILQTVALLVSPESLVRNEALAKCLVICFRLNFTKDPTVVNTASATVRQLVCQVFERLKLEKARDSEECIAELKINRARPPQAVSPFVSDAIMLFQDLCRLISGEQPFWLKNITEMTRTLGLDILEMILLQSSTEFLKRPEFTFLIKDQVCPMLIRLFSNMKHSTSQHQVYTRSTPEMSPDKPYFPITLRLLRLMGLLITRYYVVLTTECEIFLSLLIKFLDEDKLLWHRALAIELIEKIASYPELINYFCFNYDMKSQSTRVLSDLLCALADFMVSVFNGIQQGRFPEPAPNAIINDVKNVFIYKDVYIPLITLAACGIQKSGYLEMVEKVEPPVLPASYLITVYYGTITSLINSFETIVSTPQDPSMNEIPHNLISLSWKPLLSAVSLLLDCCIDEGVTESILQQLATLITLSCKAQVDDAREPLLSVLCRSLLPERMGYAATEDRPVIGSTHSTQIGFSDKDVTEQRRPAVSSPALTVKNVQAFRALICVSLSTGSWFHQRWHTVFSVLQDFFHLLNLRPVVSDSLTINFVSTPASSTASVINVVGNVSCIVDALKNLITQTTSFDRDVLIDMLTSLRSLVEQQIRSLAENKEFSFFVAAQLMEISLVNLKRLKDFWPLVSKLLMQICQLRHADFREWGSVAITGIIKSAFSPDSTVLDDELLRKSVFTVCSMLGNVQFDDVRVQQLQCVLSILSNKDQNMYPDIWLPLLNIAGSVVSKDGCPNEALVRYGFQIIQVIITEFLNCLDIECISLLMSISTKYGNRQKDLNISLSAVGNLWNLSDFIFRNRQSIQKASNDALNGLLIALYMSLSELCTDLRPAIRKSAGQTLLNTLVSHGDLVETCMWRSVFWKVLFPLLDKVKNLTFSASRVKTDTDIIGGSKILVHHSRDTESKQWSETATQTLNNVIKVFLLKVPVLLSLGYEDIIDGLCTLLHFVEQFAVSDNTEVASAALRGFQDVVQSPALLGLADEAFALITAKQSTLTGSKTKTTPSDDQPSANAFDSSRSVLKTKLLDSIWQVWLRIAVSSAVLDDDQASKLSSSPHMASLTSEYFNLLLTLFTIIFKYSRAVMDISDASRVMSVFQTAVSLPLADEEASPIVTSPLPDVARSHDVALNCIQLFYKESFLPSSRLHSALPHVLNCLLEFLALSYKPAFAQPPKSMDSKDFCGSFGQLYFPLAERSIKTFVEFYLESASRTEVIEANIAEKAIQKISAALRMKYNNPTQMLWKLALVSLLKIVHTTISIAIDPKFKKHFRSMWIQLIECFEKFLFSPSNPSINLNMEERRRNEFLDCQVIDLFRKDILPHSLSLPDDFTSRVMDLLLRGCIEGHVPATAIGVDISCNIRTELASCCFETLLYAASVGPDLLQCHGSETEKFSAALKSINSLLKRCVQVITSFPRDERLSAGTPLPRHRIAEMIQVLSALATMIERLRHHGNNTHYFREVCSQFVALYPSLVDCVLCNEAEIKTELIHALKSYQLLMDQNLKADS